MGFRGLKFEDFSILQYNFIARTQLLLRRGRDKRKSYFFNNCINILPQYCQQSATTDPFSDDIVFGCMNDLISLTWIKISNDIFPLANDEIVGINTTSRKTPGFPYGAKQRTLVKRRKPDPKPWRNSPRHGRSCRAFCLRQFHSCCSALPSPDWHVGSCRRQPGYAVFHPTLCSLRSQGH